MWFALAVLGATAAAVLTCVVVVVWFVLTPQAQRVEQRTAQTYTVYAPSVKAGRELSGKGVASTTHGAYQEFLNAQWYFVYEWCVAPDCVPMSRGWETPPICPRRLLLGNEPTAQEPAGYPMTPEAAAQRSREIREYCPDTWFIVGNNVQFWAGFYWMIAYRDAGGIIDQIGTHCYLFGGITDCDAVWEAYERNFPGVPMCITELNTAQPDAELFAQLLKRVARFGCYAAFTDQSPLTPDYPETLNMVDRDGAATENGAVFKEFNP